MKNNNDRMIKIWLIILTILLILGYGLCILTCVGLNTVYAEEPEEELNIVVESIPLGNDCYAGEIIIDDDPIVLVDEPDIVEESHYVIDVTDEDINLLAGVDAFSYYSGIK